MNLKRVGQIIRKEFIHIRRDRALTRMVALSPLFQLVIYGYVVATDIRALPMVVLDHSETAESRRLVDRFVASGYFIVQKPAASASEVTKELDSGRAMIGLDIPPDYSENVRRGVEAKVQLLVDGTNSNTAAIAIGYAQGVVAVESADRIKQNFERKGFRMIEAGIREEPRVWFNPSLRAINYMIPGIICVLLMEMMVPLTAFSVVREREKGTIEQLMVTPVRAAEILVGKSIPYVIIGLADSFVILAAGLLWFRVPMAGSLVTLLVAAAVFIFVALGLGILIATLVITQQQAALSAQFVLVPNMLLSGFMFPIASMPPAIQYFTLLLPMRYFLEIVRGIMMKGLGFAAIWTQLLAMGVLGAIIFSISWLRFRRVFG